MKNRLLTYIVRHPSHGMVGLLVMQFILWSIAPILAYEAVLMDIIESTLWGREGIIASYKHPALNAFILQIMSHLTGGSSWGGYVIAQICIVTTLWLIYRLSCHLFGDDKKALAATILMMTSFYFSTNSPNFNHNILQMPLWLGSMLATFHATRPHQEDAQQKWWWLALGIMSAITFYAKYSAIILYATIAIWLITDKDARAHLKTPYPYLALLLALIIMTPLFLWLYDNFIASLDYVRTRGHFQLDKIFFFIPAQIINNLAVFIIAVVSGLLTLRTKIFLPFMTIPPRHSHFILHFALVPLLLTILVALLLQQGLLTRWAIPMISLLGVLIIAVTQERWNDERFKKVVLYSSIYIILMPCLYVVGRNYSPLITGQVSRIHAPQAAITQFMEDQWYKQTHGRKLSIVGGNTWEAGMVAFSAKDKPSIYTHLDQNLSPWITDQRLKKEGALIIWTIHDPLHPTMPEDYAVRLQTFAILTAQQVNFPYPTAPFVPPLTLGYAILKPQP